MKGFTQSGEDGRSMDFSGKGLQHYLALTSRILTKSINLERINVSCLVERSLKSYLGCIQIQVVMSDGAKLLSQAFHLR